MPTVLICYTRVSLRVKGKTMCFEKKKPTVPICYTHESVRVKGVGISKAQRYRGTLSRGGVGGCYGWGGAMG
jgi:hypothetical protein